MNESPIPVSTLINPQGNELAVTATSPSEMAQSHDALLTWCRRRVEQCSQEAAELSSARNEAKKRKWKYTTIERHALKARKRLEFFQKMLVALEHGYTVVPNFPVEVFAVRTNKAKPDHGWTTYRSNHIQQATALPLGEGDYQNAFPVVYQDRTPEGKQATFADHWDQMEFPITMARPYIMDLTDRAMTLKIFDEIGILPSSRRNQEPMIIGTIVEKSPYKDRRVSFILAWRLDTSVL